MQNRLEFEQSVDGLFYGAIDALSRPQLKERLRTAGLDLDGRLAPAYPAEQFYRWVKIAAAELHPELSEDEACNRIGRLAVEKGLESTVLGRALLVVLKMYGTRRSMQRITKSFRNGNNYIEVTVNELAPTRLELIFNTVMETPGYFHGVLEAGLVTLGAKEPRVERRPQDGESCTYLLEWRE